MLTDEANTLDAIGLELKNWRFDLDILEMNIKTILASLCLLVAAPAIASPWTLITTDEKFTQAITVRVDSIRHHENGYVSFWLGEVNTEVNTDESEPYDAKIAVIQAHCDSQRFRIAQVNSFKEGALVGKSNTLSNVETALPASMMSEAILVACLKDHSKLPVGHFYNPKEMAAGIQAFLRDMQQELKQKSSNK